MVRELLLTVKLNKNPPGSGFLFGTFYNLANFVGNVYIRSNRILPKR